MPFTYAFKLETHLGVRCSSLYAGVGDYGDSGEDRDDDDDDQELDDGEAATHSFGLMR